MLAFYPAFQYEEISDNEFVSLLTEKMTTEEQKRKEGEKQEVKLILISGIYFVWTDQIPWRI